MNNVEFTLKNRIIVNEGDVNMQLFDLNRDY